MINRKLTAQHKLLMVIFGLMSGLALGVLFVPLAFDHDDFKKTHFDPNYPQVQWKGDPYLRGLFLPSQHGVYLQNSPVTINSQGFRGAEMSNSSRRLVCIGDSVTFGYFNADDKTYPYFLSRSLNEFEVINAGMPRWNTMNLLNLFAVKIAPLKPDIVVLLSGWNDIGSLLTQSAFKPDHVKTEWQVEKILYQREKASDVIEWARLKDFENVLRSFVLLGRANGTIVVLMTLPHFLKADLAHENKRRLLPHLLSYPNISYQGWWQMVKRTNETIRKVSSDIHAPLIDCEYEIPSTSFHDVCHLTDQGNQLLAGCVAHHLNAILKDKYILAP